jgi:hypothetical protein
LTDLIKEVTQQLFTRPESNQLCLSDEMPMMPSVFVVIAEHTAIVT